MKGEINPLLFFTGYIYVNLYCKPQSNNSDQFILSQGLFGSQHRSHGRADPG